MNNTACVRPQTSDTLLRLLTKITDDYAIDNEAPILAVTTDVQKGLI